MGSFYITAEHVGLRGGVSLKHTVEVRRAIDLEHVIRLGLRGFTFRFRNTQDEYVHGDSEDVLFEAKRRQIVTESEAARVWGRKDPRPLRRSAPARRSR